MNYGKVDPTYGDPHDNSSPVFDGFGWDITDELRINVAQGYAAPVAEADDVHLLIYISNGLQKIIREVTSDQLRTAGHLLIRMADRQDWRQAGRR